MKRNNSPKGPGTGNPVEQKKGNSKVVNAPHPTKGISDPGKVKQTTDNGKIIFCWKPYSKRLRFQQPIAVDFSQASEHIHNTNEQFQRMRRPKRYRIFCLISPGCVQGKICVCWKKDHYQAYEADEVIVIEVRALIHQLDISEAKEQQDGRASIEQTQSHAQCGKPADKKEQIGVFIQRLDEFKAIEGKKVLWLYVEVMNPAFRPESYHTPENQQPEQDPEYGQRRG